MEELLYLCTKCNKTFDESAFDSHACLKSNEDAATEYAKNYSGSEGIQATNALLTQKNSVQKSKRDGWKDEDVKRLLDIYIKNFRAVPFKQTNRNHFLWDRVMKDLKQYGDFSRFLVQSKMKKLKNTCRAITNGPPISYEWPYYQKMMDILRLESESFQAVDGIEDNAVNPEEETESDNEENNDNVQGLQRWTVKETRHLIQVYMKYLPKFFIKGQRRKILWNEVLGELQFNLPQRFSMYQIRAKIRNVQNTYRSIIDKKRKKNISYWPLFKDVELLAKLEQKLSNGFYNSFIDESVTSILHADINLVENPKKGRTEKIPEIKEKTSELRWNIEETEELLNEYKNHLHDFLDSCREVKEMAWMELTESVNLVRRRKITPRQAKEKINALKISFVASTIDEPPVINSLISSILEEEEKINGPFLPLDIKVEEPIKKKKKENSEEMITASNDSVPSWYMKYDKDANRRHREKMDVYRNIISVLENIIQPS